MLKKIRTGNHIVISAGSVILFDQKSTVELTVEIGTGFTIIVEIEFRDDDSNKQLIKKEIKSEENYIKLICYNFDNPLGTGTTGALSIANYNNKEVSMHVWSYLLGDKQMNYTRKIEYAFYMEE